MQVDGRSLVVGISSRDSRYIAIKDDLMPTAVLSITALESALQPVADATLAACDGVLARVWLTGPGDLCPGCPQRPRCPDQTRCLHLVASAGLTTRLDGPFRRYPIGSTEVGRVPLTRRAFVTGGDLAAQGLAEATWLATHQVGGFAALPLEYGGQAIGVLAVFARVEPTGRELAVLAHIAGLGALALGSLRAYRELATERNRVVARAARHRAEHAEATTDPLRPLAESEREIIERVLSHTAGKVSGATGAAAILQMKPTTLFSRMKKLGIDRRAAAIRRA
jgi:transcriptional regulator with GAF, ATPase, and Fis domain